MTVGLPMLLSDIPSHREVLSKMEKTVGFIFDNKNIDNLSNNINKIIQTVDSKTACTEIKRVFEKWYTAKKMSQSYQATYTHLYLNKK